MDTGGSLCHAAKALVDIGRPRVSPPAPPTVCSPAPPSSASPTASLTRWCFLDTIPPKANVAACEKIRYISVAHTFRRGHQPHLRGDLCLPSVLLNTTLPNRRGRATPVSSFLSEERADHVFRNNTGGAEWLLVGLGNPGTSMKIPATMWAFWWPMSWPSGRTPPIQRLKFKALTNLLTISGEKVLVMKPVTYMNLSGEAVRQAVDFIRSRRAGAGGVG